MSTNGNGWKPRKTETIECPSGQVVQVRRPGPDFIFRTGKVARTFTKTLGMESETQGAQALSERGQEVIAQMSDEELAALMLFARELIVTMVVSPKIVLNPREGFNEIGPDDIGNDFWFLLNYGLTNFVGIKVPVGESEVEVSDLETFRAEPGVQGDSVDGVHVPVTESERATTDPGLVHSAGV